MGISRGAGWLGISPWYGIQQDTVGKDTVRNLLECFLVYNVTSSIKYVLIVREVNIRYAFPFQSKASDRLNRVNLPLNNLLLDFTLLNVNKLWVPLNSGKVTFSFFSLVNTYRYHYHSNPGSNYPGDQADPRCYPHIKVSHALSCLFIICTPRTNRYTHNLWLKSPTKQAIKIWPEPRVIFMLGPRVVSLF